MTAAERTAQRLRLAYNRQKPLLMVVDDDEEIGIVVADTLRDDGYEVILATTGEGALRRLERVSRPVMVLTDIHLGAGITGLELATMVHKLWPGAGLLIISGDELPAEHPSRENYLAKPFSTAQLLNAVSDVCARPCGQRTLLGGRDRQHACPVDLDHCPDPVIHMQ